MKNCNEIVVLSHKCRWHEWVNFFETLIATLPAEKKLTATTFFTYFSFIIFFENPAPDKILKQTKTPAPIKF